MNPDENLCDCAIPKLRDGNFCKSCNRPFDAERVWKLVGERGQGINNSSEIQQYRCVKCGSPVSGDFCAKCDGTIVDNNNPQSNSDHRSIERDEELCSCVYPTLVDGFCEKCNLNVDPAKAEIFEQAMARGVYGNADAPQYRCAKCDSPVSGDFCPKCDGLVPQTSTEVPHSSEDRELGKPESLDRTKTNTSPAPGEPNKAAIIVISALFGPFGAIPANAAAKKAEAKGLPTRPYWKAFWITWLISSAVLIVVNLIFFAVVISSLNSSLKAQSLSSNAGTTSTVVDCTLAGNTIDVDGTICKQTSGLWSPPSYMQFGADLAWKSAVPGSYSCTDGDVHCLALYAISQAGCKNGITAQLDLQNSQGVSIGQSSVTSHPEQPMEIVQILIGNNVQDWSKSSLIKLTC